jgi:hypothetical protein
MFGLGVRTAMVKLSEFLEHQVEGYLFDDLATMIAATPLPGRQHGALHYPLVATCLAGIEFMGGLLSPGTFHPGHGARYFELFWSKYLYPKQAALNEPVYKFVRHGLAHVFFTKAAFCVTKGRPDRHLTRDSNDTIWLDAAKLARDLEHTYRDVIGKELGTGSNLETTMQVRLDEMLAKYTQQASVLAQVQFPPTPTLDDLAGASVASGTMVNGQVFLRLQGLSQVTATVVVPHDTTLPSVIVTGPKKLQS